ncbi:MAG: nuclease A inhibitor family protein [Armatimonadota bacterium]
MAAAPHSSNTSPTSRCSASRDLVKPVKTALITMTAHHYSNVIDAYVVGRTGVGELAGVSTQLVET